MRITSTGNAIFTGNVAINTTTSPAKNLVVEGNASQYATIRVLSNSTGHGSEIEFGDSTDVDYGSITQFASIIVFSPITTSFPIKQEGPI